MPTVEEIWNTNLQSLTQKAVKGDEGAVTALYNHYEKPMIRYARNYVSNNEDAQDAVQNAFINAFRHISSLEDGSKFEVWLRRIVRNEATSLVRGKLQNSTTYFTDMEDEEGNMQYDPSDEKIESRPDLVLDQQTTKELIVKILDSLPEEQRLVTMMYYYEHLTMKDIAQELDIPQSTVVGRINTAKKNIKTSVLSLEKKDGIKLYSLTPLTFFLYLLSLLGQTDPASIPMRVPTSISGSTRPAGHGLRSVLDSIKGSSANTVPEAPTAQTVTTSADKGVEEVLSALRESSTAETAVKAAAGKAVTHTAAKAAGTAITGKILPIVLGVAIGTAGALGGSYIYKNFISDADKEETTTGTETAENSSNSESDSDHDGESGISGLFTKDNEKNKETTVDRSVVWAEEPGISFDIVEPLEYSLIGWEDSADPTLESGLLCERIGYPYLWQFDESPGTGERQNEQVIVYRNGGVLTISSFDRSRIYLSADTGSDHGMPFDYVKYGIFYFFGGPSNEYLYKISSDLSSIEKFPNTGGLGGLYPVPSLENDQLYWRMLGDTANTGVIENTEGDYYVFIDKQNNVFAAADPTGHVMYSGSEPGVAYLRGFINGFIVLTNPAKNAYGLFNVRDNKQITEIIYEDVKYFEDGYCPVKKNGKWGFIDEQGKEVTDFIWDDVTTLYQGKAYVGKDKVYGILDLKKTISEGIPVTEDNCYKQFGGVPEPVAVNTPKPTEVTVAPMGTVYIKVTNLNSRSAPSTSAEKLAKVKSGMTYDFYETTYAEGYTWYRIGENRWIADDSGKWVTVSYR